MHPSRIHIQRRKGCDRTLLMSTFRFQDFIASLEVRVTMGQWVTWRRLTNPGSFKSIIPSDPQRSPRFFSKWQPCLSFFQGGILNQKKKRILTKSDTICSSKRRLLPESWQILISISPQNCRKKKIPRKSPKKDTGKVPVSVIQIKALLNLTGECHHIYI